MRQHRGTGRSRLAFPCSPRRAAGAEGCGPTHRHDPTPLRLTSRTCRRARDAGECVRGASHGAGSGAAGPTQRCRRHASRSTPAAPGTRTASMAPRSTPAAAPRAGVARSGGLGPPVGPAHARHLPSKDAVTDSRPSKGRPCPRRLPGVGRRTAPRHVARRRCARAG